MFVFDILIGNMWSVCVEETQIQQWPEKIQTICDYGGPTYRHRRSIPECIGGKPVSYQLIGLPRHISSFTIVFFNHVFKCLQCLRANKEELHIWLRKCHWHVAYHLQPFSSLSVSDHIYLFLAQGINLMSSDKMMAFLLNCVKHLSMFVMKIQWTFSENDLRKWQQCPARAS